MYDGQCTCRELEYVLKDAKVSAVLTTDAHMSTIAPLAHKTGAEVFRTAESVQEGSDAAQAWSDAVHPAWIRLSTDLVLEVTISPMCYKGR